MDIEAQKRQAAARARSNWCGRACGSGSAPARPRGISSSCWPSGCAPASTWSACRPRRRRAPQAERLGVPLTTLDETPELDLTVDGADEIAPGPQPDQGRRRRAAAREDRGGGLGPHGGDRRREQMGADARPLSAADRGRAVRLGRDPARGRGRGRRRRLPGPGRCCGGTRTAMLSSRTAGTGYSTPRSERIADPKSLADRLSRHPRRRRARSVHRAGASRHPRRTRPAFASSSGRDSRPAQKE